jgi:DNA-binding CsgD family transcriptional regulator
MVRRIGSPEKLRTLSIRVPEAHHGRYRDIFLLLRNDPPALRKTERMLSKCSGEEDDVAKFLDQLRQIEEKLDRLLRQQPSDIRDTADHPTSIKFAENERQQISTKSRHGNRKGPIRQYAEYLCGLEISDGDLGTRRLKQNEIEHRLRIKFGLEGRGPAQSAAAKAIMAVDPGNPDRLSRHPMARRVSLEHVDRMKCLEAEGFTRKAIAAQLGCNRRTIYVHLGRQVRRPRRTSKQRIEDMKELAGQGLSQREIARRLHCCRHTITAFLGPWRTIARGKSA